MQALSRGPFYRRASTVNHPRTAFVESRRAFCLFFLPRVEAKGADFIAECGFLMAIALLNFNK